MYKYLIRSINQSKSNIKNSMGCVLSPMCFILPEDHNDYENNYDKDYDKDYDKYYDDCANCDENSKILCKTAKSSDKRKRVRYID